MRNKKGARLDTPGRAAQSCLFFCVLLALAALVSSCGAPGEPIPPSPPIPVAITDLTAQQSGDGVLLTFTMPGKSTRSEKLKEVPAVEILRGALLPDGTPDAKSFRVVDTIPGALVNSYQQQGKIAFLDPLPPEEMRAHPGQSIVYRVRSYVSERKMSASSPDALVKVFPVRHQSRK